SLRQTLSSLRRDFAPAAETILSADDDVVAINRPHVGADVVDFERLAPSEEVGDLHLAIGLYRGDLLTDLAVSEPEFEDWIGFERARLHAVAIAVAEKLWRLERADKRIAIAQRLVALEPLKESAHQLLMRSYADIGENGLALQHYSVCRELLKTEL